VTGTHPTENDTPLIGGFFPLEPATAPAPRAAFPGADPQLARDSAGAAFGALVRLLDPPRIWLPGWLCAPFAMGLPADRLRLYRVTPDLAPDTASLAALGPGDLLLAVNHFGRAPGPAWTAFVAAHPDVFFVEDCAQALDTGTSPWGDWRLYSPRKLMGVPEGGFLLPRTPRARALPPPAIPADPARSAARRAPMALRRDHPGDNALWRPLHQQAEALADNADRAMDATAFATLAQIDTAPMIAARRANAARLFHRLPSGAAPLYDLTDPPFAPFGLPVLLPPARRDAILAHLHAQGIFAAVHWRDILSPPDWAEDHARAAAIVTLPCDHRYGPADMDRVATALARALQEETP
jgi:dTDP-4-amino-4,6-dideoxygalactose transaminase